MSAKLENPLSARNLAFGLLLAASLILPTLAHADGLASSREIRVDLRLVSG